MMRSFAQAVFAAPGCRTGDFRAHFCRQENAETRHALLHQRFFRIASTEDNAEEAFLPLVPGAVRRSVKMARVEAALFVSDSPLSARKLAQFATLADVAEANQLIDKLNAAYDATGSTFRIERVASGFQMLTRPVFANWLSKIHQRQTELKLSPPALETLTIVAYRQPITRADIESLRGVQTSEVLKQLMERGLVKIGGEEDSLGRPYLYETTRKFLEIFGLRNLNELPMAEQLRKTAVNDSAHEAAEDDEASDATSSAEDAAA